VIPLSDGIPARRFPFVNVALVAANFIVFIFYELPNLNSAVFHASFYPCSLAGTCHAPEPWEVSWFTAMFLHASWSHILGNMLFLVIFGNNVEDRMRRLPFLLFYLAAGYVSAYGFAAAYSTSTQPLIGASGAISGVLGAYIVLYPRARVWSLVPFLFFIPIRTPAWLVLGLWFVLQWVYSAGIATPGAGSVAYVAHVLGFLFGAVVGFAMRAAGPSPPPPSPARHVRRVP
jgi:membrane associated rhomboid family serine protease